MDDGRSSLKLQIVVNDEVIDLRKQNFDKSLPSKSKPVSRSVSQQLLPPRRDLKKSEDIHANGLKKLANHLYFASSPHMLPKPRNVIRNKLKNRATSADPRFRRERSPTQVKQPSFSQSASVFSNQLKPPRRIQTQSAPSFVIETAHTALEEKQPSESNNTTVAEQGTMTMNDNDCQVQTCTSNYESALSRLKSETLSKDDASNITTVADFPCTQAENISPYWDDPRLLKKYSKILKPIPIKKTKSSWTLPFTSHLLSNNIICASCSTKESVPISDTYKFDGITDDDLSVHLDKTKHRLYETFFRSYCLTPFFVLGSICGLFLVTSIIWVFANDFLWKLFTGTANRKENKSFGQWLLTALGAITLYAINGVAKSIAALLSLQRNEVLTQIKEENPYSWENIFK